MSYLLAALAWVQAHPLFASAIFWPLLTALLTTIFHARSAIEYANKSPRAAAFWKLVAAIGVDTPKVVAGLKQAAGGLTPADRALGLARAVAGITIDFPKAIEALGQLVTGRAAPAVGLLLVALLALTGCAAPGRDIARGAVLSSANAVKVADETCARVAIEKTDLTLASECEQAYADARAALLGAAKAVDAWDQPRTREGVTCSLRRAAEGLQHVVDLLRRRSVAVPEAIADAIAIAARLGSCPTGAP